MSLRGTAAIIGVGSVKPERRMRDRSGIGVAAEAGIKAVRDAGLRREDIDGLITQMPGETPTALAEYLGLRPTWSHGVVMEGATGTTSVTLAAMALAAGLAENDAAGVGGGGSRPAGTCRRRAAAACASSSTRRSGRPRARRAGTR